MNEKQKLIQEIISYFNIEIIPSEDNIQFAVGGENMIVFIPVMPGETRDSEAISKEWGNNGTMEQYANQQAVVGFECESVVFDENYELFDHPEYHGAYKVTVNIKDKSTSEKLQPNRGDDMIYSDDKLI